ncbi:hypothetical protein EJ04DRAFT_523820 [Polyplosphaeria fusca]|uniref:Uncharacterized protein n=1 Tax=Polyplosphaeria fusca TaxID=682080 RepID=A0A9P4QUS1_9PLEO|nr:hypothetical protein EJ04DRAFT_523820 [Polyplosphaeria fusca]
MALRLGLFPHPPISDDCEFSSYLAQIDDRLAYRIGCPLLPVLPVQTKLSNCRALKDISKKTIDRILARVGPCKFGLVHRFHQGQEPNDDNVTFLVLASYHRGCEGRWKDAVCRLHAIMRRNSKITVEVIDKQVAHHLPPPKEIRSNQSDILEISRRLLPTITSVISQHQWITVDILNWYLPTHGSYHPTFVISARDTSDNSWWSTTLPDIRRAIKETGNGLEVVLLFLDRLNISATPLTNYQPADVTIIDEFYNEEFSLGTSCGLAGSDRSGTLEGSMVVEKGGKQIQLGLTNCHVLLQDAGLNLKNTIGPCLALEELKAVSPSDVDHEVRIREIQDDVAVKSENLQRFEQVYGEEELSQLVKHHIEEQRKDLEGEQSRLTKPTSHNRFLGTIFATSGFTTWPRTDHSDTFQPPIPWGLDWCLIRLGNKVRLSNLPQHLPENVEIRGSVPVSFWARVDPFQNYKVMKRGRSTEWTKGIISAIDSTINPGNGLLHLRLGEPTIAYDTISGCFEDKPVAVHTVVSNSKSYPHFIKSGDSGSLVLLNEKAKGPQGIPPGTVVGMVSASNNLVSYMVPMEVIIKSIDAATGGRVVQPQEWTSPTNTG